MTLDYEIDSFFKELEQELAGAAQLEVQDNQTNAPPGAPPVVYVLHPSRSDASIVRAYVTGESSANVEFGKACIVELWDDDEELLAASVKAFVRAVVAGNLQETVWSKGPNVLKSKGELEVDGKVHRIHYRQGAVSVFGLGKRGKEHYDYAPYRDPVRPN